MTHKMDMAVRGIARDAHANFPIRFDYAQSGNAFFLGCKIESEISIGNGSSITKRMDIRAFGEVAEELAHVTDGLEIEVEGSYDLQKNQKDGKYYPVLTVRKVIEA